MPRPRKNRPSIIDAAVADAWAMIAGWIRIVGHVTPVPSRIRSVACEIPPITDQTNGLWPCESVHGWKWSEIIANSSPVSSARRASWTRSFGGSSSYQTARPKSVNSER